MSWFVSDELVPVELEGCRCVGSPHAHDIIWLKPELDAAGGWEAMLVIRQFDGTESEDVISEGLGRCYLDWGIAAWSFLDDDGGPVPVTRELIRKLQWDAVVPVAEKASELYSEALTRPLVARASRSSSNGHAAPSTSRRKRSSSVLLKP